MPILTTCGSLCFTLHAGGVDEEGLDQGGVKKEFFQLLTREIFNEVSDGSGPISCPSQAYSRRQCPQMYQCTFGGICLTYEGGSVSRASRASQARLHRRGRHVRQQTAGTAIAAMN